MQYLRIHADVDLDAACHNLRQVRRQIGPAPKLLAVIKADGYGHGAVPLAHAFSSEGLADYFGVATLEEAIELRRSRIKTPILILGYTSPTQFQEVISQNLTQTVYTYEAALGLSQAARRAGKQALVHLALETGMGRIGFWDNAESVNVIRKIAALPCLKLEGIFSHFSKADEQDLTYAREQLERYLAFDRKLKAAGDFHPFAGTSATAPESWCCPNKALRWCVPASLPMGYLLLKTCRRTYWIYSRSCPLKPM